MPHPAHNKSALRFDGARERIRRSGQLVNGYTFFFCEVERLVHTSRVSTLRLVDAMERAADYAEEKAAEKVT